MLPLLIAIAVLFAADAATTVWILKHGGRELNPALARLMGGIGTQEALAVAKLATFAALLLWREAIPIETLAVLAAVYVAALAWNVRVMLKLRRP